MYIEIDRDKDPYIKEISKDKVINLAGESGSGKSYYVKHYFNSDDYIVIDTDEVFSRFENSSGENREFGKYLRDKYETLPSIIDEFDLIYEELINYFKDSSKTLVIDSAQFRNIKNIELLKGKIIVMRTSIDTCYERCINRWISNHNNYSLEELEKYKERKRGMYSWYKGLNQLIDRVEKL